MNHFVRNATTLTMLAGLAFAAPQDVEAQAVGYTLMPGASRIDWGTDFPLQDDWFAGGRLAITFGPQVELQPFYFRLSKTGIDGARGSSVFGPANVNRTTRVEHAGSMVQLNFGGYDLAPFLRVGGGVLRFTPDSGEDRKRITLGAGAGLRFTLGALEASLFAEQHRFRMRPGTLFGGDTTALVAGEAAPVQRATMYGASLNIPLSSFSQESSFDWLSGTRAPLEPFVGRFTHDTESQLPRQDLIGVRTGIDFNSLFGIRGFYWRAVNDDRDGFESMAGYGGEAQFNLNAGPGVAPYLVAGAGKLDFLNGYSDIAGRTVEDQTTLIVGGGVALNLSERVRLNVAVRDFITSGQGSLDDATRPDDLMHNRLVSAGFSFSLGGSAQAPRRERTPAEPRRTARDEPAARERDTARDARDVRAVQPVAMQPMIDSSGRTAIMVPAPNVGEIIIRYGQVGSTAPVQIIRPMTEDMAMQRSMRAVDTVRLIDTVRVSTGVVDLPTDMSTLVERMDAMERRLNERMDRMMAEADMRPEARPAEPAATPSQPVRPRSDSRGLFSRIASARTSDFMPFAGIGGGDGAQFVAGGRADLGALRPGSPFDLVPELSVASGSGNTSVLAMTHLRYSVMQDQRLRPYVMAGAGIFSETVLGLSTSLGAAFDLQRGSGRSFEAVAELQGINLFDRSRLLFGIRLGR